MLLPTKVDLWYAEAVTRVYAPWLTPRCIWIDRRQRRDVAELIRRARRAACLPPLDQLGPPTAAPSSVRPLGPERVATGRWVRPAA